MGYIPGGSFQMGSTDNEHEMAQYTTPIHTVTLQTFEIGAYWEQACREGSTTLYSFRDADADLVKYCWYVDNSGSQT
jgi:formylglycine-generating enzyme required for sulfatase activity